MAQTKHPQVMIQYGDHSSSQTVEAPLHGRVLGTGQGILFLHGLAASHSYWDSAFDLLAEDHRLVFVDLRGFGGSIDIKGPYHFSGHLEKLEEFQTCVLESPASVLVGHSFGALLALCAASHWPHVRGVVALNLPAFRDEEEARRQVARLNMMARWIARGSLLASSSCWLMCHLRPLFHFLAPTLAPQLPPAVARAGVEHRWPAFKGTFETTVRDARIQEWLASTSARVVIVQGEDDDVCPPTMLRRNLADARVEIHTHPGDHHLPLRAPVFCAQQVRQLLDELSLAAGVK